MPGPSIRPRKARASHRGLSNDMKYQWIRQIYHSNFLEYICGGVLIAFTAVCLMQVLTRYLMVTHPWVGWSEELARLLFVWSTFLGATVLVKREEHLGVDFIINKLSTSGKPRKGLVLFKHLCMFIIAFLLLRYGIAIVKITAKDYMTTVGYPRNVFYMPGPVSGFLMLFYLIPRIIQDVADLIRLSMRRDL